MFNYLAVLDNCAKFDAQLTKTLRSLGGNVDQVDLALKVFLATEATTKDIRTVCRYTSSTLVPLQFDLIHHIDQSIKTRRKRCVFQHAEDLQSRHRHTGSQRQSNRCHRRYVTCENCTAHGSRGSAANSTDDIVSLKRTTNH